MIRMIKCHADRYHFEMWRTEPLNSSQDIMLTHTHFAVSPTEPCKWSCTTWNGAMTLEKTWWLLSTLPPCCCIRPLSSLRKIHSPFSTYCSAANEHSFLGKSTDPGTNEAPRARPELMKGLPAFISSSDAGEFPFGLKSWDGPFLAVKTGGASSRASWASLALLRQQGTDMRWGADQWHSHWGRGRKGEEESVVNVHAKQYLKDL